MGLEHATADNANLYASLGQLAGLVAGTVELSGLLKQVATLAEHAIPGADGAGVTLLRTAVPRNRIEALATSHRFVSEIHEIQYVTLDEGPCVTATLEARIVRSGSLGGEKMWPRFGPRVGRLGVHSALSLPLLVSGQVVGGIDVYAHAKDVFDDRATEVGELFAASAAVTVRNAQILAGVLALTTQLQSALATRPVIEQAIGLLRGRSGGTAEEAFSRLRVISQSEHTKLVDVAQHIVNQAVRRARARRCNSWPPPAQSKVGCAN
jgi:GAF domain-containing protein